MEVDLLLVPYDAGQRAVRMGRGPARLVESGLVEGMARAGARGLIHMIESKAEVSAEISTNFELLRRLSRAVKEAWGAGRLPAVLAGNCLSAVGTVAGLGAGATGVIWFDAHGDLHTPATTTSGLMDGMALAALLGHGWEQMLAQVPGHKPVAASDVVLVGARDLDPAEVVALDEWGIRHITVEDIKGRGARELLAEAAQSFGPWVDRAYVHVDLDVLDPAEGRANHLAVPGGLSVDHVLEAVAGVAEHLHLGALALTAYDPAEDPDQHLCRAAARILQGFVRAADEQPEGIRLRPEAPDRGTP